MEKINIPSSSGGKKIKDIGVMLSLLSLFSSSCKEVKQQEAAKSAHPQNEVFENKKEKGKDRSEALILQESWEYKIHKLNLKSITPIKSDLLKAQKKIHNNSQLSKHLQREDFIFEKIIPIAIKETMMTHNQSKGKAIGYLQLMDIALREIKNHYWDLKLDVKDPVDNLILWALYMKILKKQVNQELKKHQLSFSEQEKEALIIISYNVGPTATIDLLKRSKCKDIQSFIDYLVKYIGGKPSDKKDIDSTYNISYQNNLAWTNIDGLKGKKHKKIAEGIRYYDIIDGIKHHLTDPTPVELLAIVECSPWTTLFSQVKKMRDEGIFKKNAAINDICNIILECNGFRATETPEGRDLFLYKEALESFLPKK